MLKNFPTICIARLLLGAILCVLGVHVAAGLDFGRDVVQGTVLKISPSPGMWTGAVQSTQWFDIKVTKSQVSTIKPDTVLHIGVLLVMGSPLFDQQKREFAKDTVSPGKVLVLQLSAMCSKSQDTDHYVVEPKCIVPSKKHQVRGGKPERDGHRE